MKFIYHASCSDGFCAAWIANNTWNNIEFMPAQYDKTPPPDVTGHDVIIADFSYDRSTMLDMKSKAKSLLVFDHHKSAECELKGLDFCTFDMNKSGARLIYDYIKSAQIPLKIEIDRVEVMVDYTEDRDLWLKKLRKTDEINAVIRSYPLDFEIWNELSYLLTIDNNLVIEQGIAILRYQQNIIDQHLKNLWIIDIDGVEAIGCMSSVGSLWSDICNNIITKHNAKIAVVWCDVSNIERNYSLRSTKNGPDVSLICGKFGGGGHHSAGSFRVDTKCDVIKSVRKL